MLQIYSIFTTNFDETWHTFHTQCEYGFEVIWAHITHKQKIQPPKAAKVASYFERTLLLEQYITPQGLFMIKTVYFDLTNCSAIWKKLLNRILSPKVIGFLNDLSTHNRFILAKCKPWLQLCKFLDNSGWSNSQKHVLKIKAL